MILSHTPGKERINVHWLRASTTSPFLVYLHLDTIRIMMKFSANVYYGSFQKSCSFHKTDG
jgi:hypothetical protein